MAGRLAAEAAMLQHILRKRRVGMNDIRQADAR